MRVFIRHNSSATSNNGCFQACFVLCSIPFFIAAPVTTLDSNLPSGTDIVIEQRPGSEITHYKGQQVAAEGIEVYYIHFYFDMACVLGVPSSLSSDIKPTSYTTIASR